MDFIPVDSHPSHEHMHDHSMLHDADTIKHKAGRRHIHLLGSVCVYLVGVVYVAHQICTLSAFTTVFILINNSSTLAIAEQCKESQ